MNDKKYSWEKQTVDKNNGGHWVKYEINKIWLGLQEFSPG